MISVLLADTDPENLRYCRTYIQAAYPEMRVIPLPASNSRPMEELITEMAPDLVVGDIRLFGPAMVPALANIHEQLPDLVLVLYGGFKDGEYLTKAHEYGMVASFFRPVKQADLSRALEQANGQLRLVKERRDRDQLVSMGYREHVAQFKDLFLNSWLSGHIRNDREIQHAFHYFQIKLTAGYTVLLFRIDHFATLILALDEEEKHVMIYRLNLAVQQRLSGRQAETLILGFNTVAAVVGGHPALEELITLSDEVKKSALEEQRIRVTAGIGRTYNDPGELGASYREAEAALRFRSQMGYNSVIPIHFVDPDNHITYRYAKDKEEKLISAAVIGEYAYCRDLLGEICDSLRECEPLPDKLLSKIVMDILFAINRYTSEQGIPTAGQFVVIFPSKDAIEIETIDAVYEYLDKALARYCDFILENREKRDEKLFASALKYVETHYHDSFSISKIAMSLSTTPEYLLKVSRQRDATSLYDYAMGFRMEEARKLLRESDLDDDMIAVRVGYIDGRHFRSVFRQKENMSTAAFREMHRKR